MGLMGNLYVGTSGLRVNQYALNTTAHNLANVDTNGFVRQQTLHRDGLYLNSGWTSYNTLQVGLGVDTWTVRQVRDAFLDKSYRLEVGRQGFYDAQNEAIHEMEDLFGELQGVSFQDTLKGFWESLQELSKQPDSLVARSTFVETAVTLVDRSESIYRQLTSYQVNLNAEINIKVNRVNEISDRIHEINNFVAFYEANNVEHANDLRDERNNLLDELGQIIKISYKEEKDRRVVVMAEGIPLVTQDSAFHMGTMTVTEQYLFTHPDQDLGEINNNLKSDMIIPVWPKYGNIKVISFEKTPDTKTDTDVGSLKGLLLARGDRIAKYMDVPVAPVKSDYMTEDGELDEEAYEIAAATYERDTLKYNKEIAPSVILTVLAQFDQLMHGIVTSMNDILCPNKEVELINGAVITYKDGSTKEFAPGDKIYILDEEKAGVGTDGPPPTMGEELFSRKSVARYSEPEEMTITLPDGTISTVMARVYVEEDPKNNYTLYTLGEIRVNQALLEDKSKLPLSTNTNTGDYDIGKVEELIDSWQNPFATLSPNTLTKNNFYGYYNSFISELAFKGETLQNIADSQASMVDVIRNQRQEVAGVSSDEELTNIIKYQHAYNAAARYINVVDELIEHVINRM